MAGAVLWAVATAGNAAAAPDVSKPVPAGWQPTADARWHAAGGRVAVGVADVALPGRFGVLTTDLAGQGAVVTPVQGRLLTLEVSPAGSHFLVRAQVHEQPITTSLVGADGVVDWQVADSRWYSFSNTGESLIAWDPAPVGAHRGHVEVFDLAGTSLRSWQAVGRPVDAPPADDGPLDLIGALAIGTGKSIVVSLGRATTCIDLSGPQPALVWAVQLEARQQEVQTLSWLDADTLLLDQYSGRFTCLRPDGSNEYFFYPWLWAPGVAEYAPSALPGTSEILLLAAGEEPRIVDPSTRAIRTAPLDLQPPPGHVKAPGAAGKMLLFTSPTAITLRPVA